MSLSNDKVKRYALQVLRGSKIKTLCNTDN